MNLNQLEYFVSAARDMNFTKAAKECYISQTAMTQQIQALEKTLGVKLFIRDKHHMELTTAGSVYLKEAKAILKGSGLEDADIDALLPGMIAGLDKVEDVQARANAYVSAMNKFRDNAIKEHDKDVLDGTKTPGGDGDSGEDDKTEDVINAEKISFGGVAKEAQTARDYYK